MIKQGNWQTHQLKQVYEHYFFNLIILWKSFIYYRKVVMRSVKIKIMDEIIGQAKGIKLMVPERIHAVIYKLVVARKLRLTGRFSLAVALIWSDSIVGWRSQRRLGDSTACVTSACPIYVFPTSNTSSRKYYLWKKKWLVEK